VLINIDKIGEKTNDATRRERRLLLPNEPGKSRKKRRNGEKKRRKINETAPLSRKLGSLGKQGGFKRRENVAPD
jgi:hypothetical protein